MTLFQIIKALEHDESSHLGRVLVLLHEFSGREGKGEIQGLTKLAKLDFLLRYPAYLERALSVEGKNIKYANVQEHERRSVEAKMVRFKYGPWDFRYRRFINTLVGMGLMYVRLDGNSYNLGLTDKGIAVVTEILKLDAFSDLRDRAKLIRINFNMSGTNLMKFIYKTFPEISSLQYGIEIA